MPKGWVLHNVGPRTWSGPEGSSHKRDPMCVGGALDLSCFSRGTLLRVFEAECAALRRRSVRGPKAAVPKTDFFEESSLGLGALASFHGSAGGREDDGAFFVKRRAHTLGLIWKGVIWWEALPLHSIALSTPPTAGDRQASLQQRSYKLKEFWYNQFFHRIGISRSQS